VVQANDWNGNEMDNNLLSQQTNREKRDATYESLIPKKVNVVDIKDLCPISLVGCVYKIISKVMANRLKSILGKIISCPQNTFIRGRQIMDLVLVANECLDNRIRSKPRMLCKLDLENAYDYVN
jgi:hypothetical protein